MAFFEQVGKRITDAGQGVAKQTKNLAEVTRLNAAISECEKNISQLYFAIGESYFGRHKDDADAEELEKLTGVKELLEKIRQYREEIKQIKGVVKCPSCGADVPLEAGFCSKCGGKMA